MGAGFAVRHRALPGRRRLHLRRGDGDLQLDRGLPGRAPEQAAVPGRGRPVREADPGQQRRDARQRAAHPRAGGPAFAAIGTEGSTGTKLFCVSGADPAPGRVRGAVRRHAWPSCSRSPGACPTGTSCGPSCSAAPRAVRRPRRAGPAAHVRGDQGGGRDARLGRGDGAGRDRRTWCRSCSGSPPSSGTSRAGSACPAGSGPSGRRRRCTGWPPAAEAAQAGPTTWHCWPTSAASMRDASICGLGQTASSAVESAIARSGCSRERRETGGAAPASRRADASTARPCGRPRARTILDACRAARAARSRRSATATRSPRRTPAGSAWSRWRARGCSCRRAHGRSSAGMVVRTDTDRAHHSRRLVLELLGSSVDLSIAPEVAALDRGSTAPSRVASGPRRSAAAAGERDGLVPARTMSRHWRAPRPRCSSRPKVDNDLYVRDYAKCILCYKCVDACGEQWQGTFAITRGRSRVRRPHLDRVRGAPHRLGVRVLRQLHRGLPHRRAWSSRPSSTAGPPARGTRSARPRPTPSAPTAAWAAP